MKINLQIPKRRSMRKKPLALHSPNPNALAARLAELHREHGSIGPLLFGIKYPQKITDCPDSVQEIVRLSNVGTGYATDVHKGIKLAAHVSARGDDA